MEWQFVIPRVNSELLSSDKNNYCVGRVLDSQEIPDALRNARSALNDPFGVFDHFDTFYSVIDNAQLLSGTNLLRAHDLLYIGVDRLGTRIADLLGKTDLPQEDRLQALNAVKMLVYLMGGTVKAIDAYINSSKDSVGLLKKGFNKKKDNEQVEALDWDNKRYRCIVQLYNLFQLPLEKLWDPPVCEESFVDVICDICYRTLEQSYVKSRSVSDSVFQILGTAIKRYNHALSFPVRTLQILEQCEASIAPIASGVMLLYEEFGIATIYPVLIKELIERLSVDAADTQTARHCSQFMLELGTLAPKLIIPHLSTLSEELLGLESYVVRNCVLQIMGEAIVTELTSEELTDELKETRDDFLQDLLNHIMDVSAHVRSKVLQIWHNIERQNAVPLSWQHQVLEKAVERLEDKALIVRKNAIALIKAFLEHNPFSAKLSLAELRTQYEQADIRLQEIRTKLVEQGTVLKKIEEDWEDLTVQMYPVISEVLSKENSSEDATQSEGTMDDVGTLVKEIGPMIEGQRYKELIHLACKVDFALGNTESRKTLNVEQQCLYYMMVLKKYYITSRQGPNHNEEFEKIENEVNFLKDSIRFSEIVSDAVPKLQDMLMSKSQSDVFEAIDFFTSAYLFGIRGTECGMQQMLYLVWSSDAEKRNSVAAAYKRVLLEVDLEGRAKSVKVVRNLCQFMINLTMGHYTAMEVLVKEWVESGDLDAQMIQVMFELYTKKLENVTDSESRQALQLLLMVSVGKPSVVTANQTLLESIGFGQRGRADPRIFTTTLSILMNSIPKPKDGIKYYKRFESDSATIEKVVDIFVKLFFKSKLNNFDSIGTKTFDFIYKMVNTPDLVSQNILITIYEKLQALANTLQKREENPLSQDVQIPGATQEEQNRSSQATQTSKQANITLPTMLIGRFILIIGYVAMREMIHLDIDVYGNLKYRQELKDELKNIKKKTAQNKNASMRKTISMDVSASNALKRLSGTSGKEQEQQDEEELLSGATAEDTIAEKITYICETEMLYTKESLLGRFVPTIIEVCKHPNRYKDDLLQKSSVLTLIRLMSVSSSFCETNMPFLMNILQHTKNNHIKCNIVIGLSDLTFRFPNVIEPWTSHMYATLHEKNTELRLTAVKMLSNLILHEMIRVKGQISDLAMCIVDSVAEIRTITEQFFKEIANKSNILYNVLPDIISRLSDPSLALEEEKYHIIMQHIIGLINKDKQIESLVEKLCLRFRVTSEQRQWRDIAFCLSLLSYNEKTIKKLSENIGCFKDKVQYDEILGSFKTIISNTNKLAKPELKNAVAEFESRLEECLTINEDGGAAGGGGDGLGEDEGPSQSGGGGAAGGSRGNRGKALPAGKSSSQRNKATGSKTRRGRQQKVSSSESETSDSEEENMPPAASARAAARARQNKKITKVIESDNSDENEIQPQPKKGKGRR
ncbi:condensin complex subunit 1 isoform X2 [Toxorhynchites rutilus septentrionalis]|uniref:condensin complex subunit 1 isoform X2 n=1 Tax=Toxorhynchites rutilus septentrionalis TaxID=329112 RepID=UPI00247A38EF|nr:condensin complex subunit 1 isoform X2 [Toxorhynchites rutilus septentrionalis]